MTRTYSIQFLIAALLVFIGAAIINLIADPYGIWGTPRINGINSVKSSGFHGRIPKYVEWSHWVKSPQTILLGTSRTADGLRTDHAALQNGTVYNMALGGQPFHETLVLFKHALKRGGMKRVVIGLDFFAFNAYWATDVVDQKRLSPGHNFDLLFSTSTLSDSITTIRQSLPVIETIRSAHAADHGLSDAALQPPAAMPVRVLFKEVEKIFATYYRPSPFHLYAYSTPETGENTIEDFRELLNLAYLNDVELHLFISPSHAWQWEVLADVGLWENWENWKNELVRINKEQAGKAGKPVYPLWDFSGYNSISTETVPASNTAMKWYSDPSHYNKACGDLILDRIFDHHDPARPLPQDFGILIDEGTIDAHLSEIRAARKLYSETHPADAQEMADLSKQFWNH